MEKTLETLSYAENVFDRAVEREDELESLAAEYYMDKPIHLGAGFCATLYAIRKLRGWGIELGKNQKRAVGYSVALGVGHVKEEYRDEVYSPGDLLAFPLGVEMAIRYDEQESSVDRYSEELLNELEGSGFREEVKAELEILGKL